MKWLIDQSPSGRIRLRGVAGAEGVSGVYLDRDAGGGWSVLVEGVSGSVQALERTAEAAKAKAGVLMLEYAKNASILKNKGIDVVLAELSDWHFSRVGKTDTWNSCLSVDGGVSGNACVVLARDKAMWSVNFGDVRNSGFCRSEAEGKVAASMACLMMLRQSLEA